MYRRPCILAAIFLCLAASHARGAIQAAQAKPEPTQQTQTLSPQASPQPQALPQSSPEEKAAKDEGQKESRVKRIAEGAPIVTAIVAVLFGLLAWRFNERSIRRLARQDHIRMLFDIDKAYIDKPVLWRIYKDEFSNLPLPTPVDPWDEGRRRGLIYMYLNLFDAVYDFDRHLNWRNLNWRMQSDREYKDSWTAMMCDFFARSPEAVQIMTASRTIYSKEFVEYVEKCMRPMAKATKPSV